MARAGIGSEIEGRHAVAAAVDHGRVDLLRIERARLGAAPYAALRRAALAAGARVEVVDDVRPWARTAAPQGVVARARPIEGRTLEDVVAIEDPPALLVLDHLQDPRNVGAAARSALAAGMTGLVVGTRRAAPLGATAFKTAAGALERLPVATVSSIADAVGRLGSLGLWRVGLEATAERSLFGLELLADAVAVVVGAEDRGLARLVRARLDVLVRVPMAGGVESLNAVSTPRWARKS